MAGRIGYIKDYSRERRARLEVPSYAWGHLSMIDGARQNEVDDIFKIVQMHREQYTNDTGKLHPLFCFKNEETKYQCAPGPTISYFSKYPTHYPEHKHPLTLPLTYERQYRTPGYPDLSLAGVYNSTPCTAYKY